MPFKNSQYYKKNPGIEVLVDAALNSSLKISDGELKEREALLTPGRVEKMLAVDKFFIDMLDSSLITYDMAGNLDQIEDLFNPKGGKIILPTGEWKDPAVYDDLEGMANLDPLAVKRNYDSYVTDILPIIGKLRILNHAYTHVGQIFDRPPSPTFTWEGHTYQDWLTYTDILNMPIDPDGDNNMSWDFIAYLKKRRMGDLPEDDEMVTDLLTAGWSYADIGGQVTGWDIPEAVKREWKAHPEEYGDPDR